MRFACADRVDAHHVNGNGFNNYFYNVSEYTATLGPSRLAGLQLPFYTTPWHRVLGCPIHEPSQHADSRTKSLKLQLRSRDRQDIPFFQQTFIFLSLSLSFNKILPFLSLHFLFYSFTFTWSKFTRCSSFPFHPIIRLLPVVLINFLIYCVCCRKHTSL